MNGGGLMEQDEQLPEFQLLIKSEETEESSEYWQRQCCLLYNTISRNITEGSIEPLTCKAEEGERGIIAAFNVLSASGLLVKSFGHVLDIVKTWLESRPKARVLMKFPNGSEIEISGMSDFSKSEILSLFEKSLRTDQV